MEVTFSVDLPNLGTTRGQDVKHTFRAQKVYCIETLQWACGTPIAWTKCYRSESPTQIIQFLNNVWKDHPELKPGFLAYDSACKALRYVAGRDDEHHWIYTTKFIVDVWHYIGHQASDLLCRTWCNPAPLDGSQPDLIRVEEDEDGNKHITRAFNTETAEQFNAWLDGFDAMLRQMSDVNFDIYIHVLMLLFGEKVAEGARTEDAEDEGVGNSESEGEADVEGDCED